MAEIAYDTLTPRSQEKRSAILNAAQTLFLENGYGATSMDAVADEAGVSKRTVYSHFSSKEALFSSIMIGMCSMMADLPSDGPDPCHDGQPVMGPQAFISDAQMEQHPSEVLFSLGRRLVNLLLSTEGIGLFRVVVAEAERFPKLGEEYYKTGPEQLIDRLADYLSHQADLGVIQMEDPKRAAWQFASMVKEPYHLQNILGIQIDHKPEQLDREVAGAVKLFLDAHQVTG